MTLVSFRKREFTNLVLGKECEYLPTVDDGLACRKILDAAVLSASEKRFVTVWKFPEENRGKKRISENTGEFCVINPKNP